ncbi:hypothetical protein ACWIID_40910 [Streptomyces phaeochromogenes]
MSTSAPTSLLQDGSGGQLPQHRSGGGLAPTALLLGFFTVLVDAMTVPSSLAVLREAFSGPGRVGEGDRPVGRERLRR